MSNILIIAEPRDQGLHPIVYELMGAARMIHKERNGRIEVVMIGNETDTLASKLLSIGADAVHLLNHYLLKEYSGDAYVKVLEDFMGSIKPDLILMGQTPIGRDLAPRLAFRLNSTVAMDCIDMGFDSTSGRFKVRRPIYGGSILADYNFGSHVDHQIVTVRAKSFAPIEPDAKPSGKINRVSVSLDPTQIRTKTVERKSLLKEGEVRLEDADIIVSGGCGLGGPDSYRLIEELARSIGGQPGASRPVCDLGWTDHSRHIGLTGKIVAPNLYIAVAISGAMHHVAGCAGAKIIVGINIDPKASIFKYSKYGIVGDYAEVVPELIRQLNLKAN